MPEGGWPPLVLAVGGCASVYLVLGRGGAAALLVLVPLVLWFVAATRVTVGLVGAGVQAAIVTGIASATGGHLFHTSWTPSIWDGAIVYALMALASGIAAVRDQRMRLRMHSYRAAHTPARRRLARAGAVTLPAVLLMTCCLGAVLSLQVHPVKPPDELVYPLPEGVSATYEATRCGRGPAVVCTWSIDVDSWTMSWYALRDQVADHLSNAKGWPSPRSRERCRAWGWFAKEHACLTVELREVLFPRPNIDPVSLEPVGGSHVDPVFRLVVVIEYW